ncbi:exosortase-associated EpsI family protein [Chloroflexota bacterium]
MIFTTMPAEPEQTEETASGSIWKEHSLLIGLGVLVVILFFLLATPEQLFYHSLNVEYVDSQPGSLSKYRVPVLPKFDFTSNEQLSKFPTEIAGWTGSDFDTSRVEEILKPDVILMRAYSKPGLYQPVFLLLIHSRSRTSFHPPPVCYPALGWTIEEEAIEPVSLEMTGWAAEPFKEEIPSVARHPEYRGEYYVGGVPARKLVVFKQSGERVTERRVVLYFYLKDDEVSSSRMTMIRLSALAPLSGSYDEILNSEKELIIDAFPHMFEIQPEKQSPMLIVHLAKSGVGGWLLLALLFSIPLAFLTYHFIQRASSRKRR